MRFCRDINSWLGGKQWQTAGVPPSPATLLSAVDCFPTVPASPLPGARRSQDCSFEGLLNFNGEINEPQSHPFGPSQSVHQCEEEAFYTQHHVWCPGSILRTRKDCLSLSGPRYFGPSFASDGSQESDAEEGREMVSTPKVFRHKTRRKKRKRFNPYLPTAPCDESTWEPEDEVVSCPVITSDMSVSDALAAVACRATSCTKWEDAVVTCAEIAEATCAPGSTAYDLAEAWLLSSQDEEVIEVGILAALTRSLVPGIAERADPSELRLVSANVTAWNKEALEWCRQDPHRLWLVQETHLTPKTIEPFRVQVHKAGLTAYGGLGTMHPLSNRAWGGVAVVAPKHLNCRFIKEFVAEGCGFVLVGVPGVAGEILVG